MVDRDPPPALRSALTRARSFARLYGLSWVSTFLHIYMSLEDTSLHLYEASFGKMACAQADPSMPLPLKSLLWRMALSHRQPTAQKQSIVAFLKQTGAVIETMRYMLEEDGILEGVLIPVLAEERTTRGRYGEEIAGLLDGFYGGLAGLGVDVWRLVGRVVGVMGTARPGVLVACARAVVGMAGDYRVGDVPPQHVTNPISIREGICRAGRALQRVVFGSNYGAVRCHDAMMRVGRVVFSGGQQSLVAYLDTVPAGLVVRGGALREVATRLVMDADSRDLVGSGLSLGVAFPAGMWLWLYLRGEAVEEAGGGGDAAAEVDAAMQGLVDASFAAEEGTGIITASRPSVILLPCVRLLLEEAGSGSPTPSSSFARRVERLGMVDAFWKMACGFTGAAYRPARFPGVDMVRQLMHDTRAQIEEEGREFAGDLEQFLQRSWPSPSSEPKKAAHPWVEMREGLATRWEFVAGVAAVLKDGSHADVLRVQLVECLGLIETAIDEVLGWVGEEAEKLSDADWHAVFEVLLFDSRVLSLTFESLSTLSTISSVSTVSTASPSSSVSTSCSSASSLKTALGYLEAGTALLDRGPGTLNKSLRGWFDCNIWRTVNACCSFPDALERDRETERETSRKVAGLAVAGLTRSRDGDRVIVLIIRCLRTILPSLVVANDASTVSSVASALLGVASSHCRRRLGITAAILTTLVHPCFFTDTTTPDMQDVVHTSVMGLVQVAKRYPRLFVTLSSHLAAMLLGAPGEQRLQYIDVLQELVMGGFETEEQALELRSEVLDGSLSEVLSAVPIEVARAYRLSECAPRIATLCLLHEWAHGDRDGSEVCRRLWDRLLHVARTDKALSKGNYMHGGALHKRKLRLWQAIATLCPVVPDEDLEDTLVVMMSSLRDHNHASVRYYQELIALSLVLRRPSLLETRVFPALADYSSQRRDDLASVFCIVAVTLDNLRERGDPTYGDMVAASIEHILPWTGAFPHGARTFSQIIMSDILQRAERDGVPLDGNMRRLGQFFRSNDDLRRMLAAMGMPEGAIPPVRIDKALHPTGIVKSEGYTLISRDFEPRRSKYTNVENTPMSLVERMVEFLQERRVETRTMQSDIMSQVASENAVLGCAYEQEADGAREGTAGRIGRGANVANDANWQRKITYDWSGALGLDIVGDKAVGSDVKIDQLERAVGNADRPPDNHGIQGIHDSGRSIIVVASYIDKVPNLAGLCRTCEIFQAQALVVHDATVKEHPDFHTISVSADTWVQMEEVKRDDIVAWLRGMKRDGGWSLVGLEQTDDSVSLPEFEFPDRTILVLGAEKEGIPMDVLRLLDSTVEIPQLGIIRLVLLYDQRDTILVRSHPRFARSPGL